MAFRPRSLAEIVGVGPGRNPDFTLWVTKTGGHGPSAKFSVSWFNDFSRGLTRGEVIAALRAAANQFEIEGMAQMKGRRSVSN